VVEILDADVMFHIGPHENRFLENGHGFAVTRPVFGPWVGGISDGAPRRASLFV
jgi:hypothetical protein